VGIHFFVDHSTDGPTSGIIYPGYRTCANADKIQLIASAKKNTQYKNYYSDKNNWKWMFKLHI
ncbi:MAG: hypothetical protein GTO45_26315, partial [Candidatus Aminicenantes bacterium]|nr:hypothetical protein [Candidatus Aminicenantes bacterium]NIM82267.1 hypothetical protein [Candidatus Aminicenantes bacterium]NIN21657.1 hypothetical protein [Candidatus Aminicenantes bacterium]NIN45454.1 hypothetical protein [Candidatus Aminicenantes bacterium]NIN88284.1 hypothetical protein [Candidatus Aminicenantes bacterium]